MRIWIPALAATLTMGCAPTPQPATGVDGGSQVSRCFNTDRVVNFAADNTRNVYLRSQRGDVYELTGSGGCSDIDFASGLTVAPLSGISTRLCLGEEARVSPQRAGRDLAPTLCRFTVARVLNSEEVAALPSGSRP